MSQVTHAWIAQLEKHEWLVMMHLKATPSVTVSLFSNHDVVSEGDTKSRVVRGAGLMFVLQDSDGLTTFFGS